MCDYSLMTLPNRLAIFGEELVVHRFESGVVGLASVSDVSKPEENLKTQPSTFFSKLMKFVWPPRSQCCPAVCVPPGARLLVRDIPATLQLELGLESEAEEVVFTQTSASASFRDAIRFRNGTDLLLQRLTEGQRVHVLALSSEEPSVFETGRLVAA